MVLTEEQLRRLAKSIPPPTKHICETCKKEFTTPHDVLCGIGGPVECRSCANDKDY